MATTRGARGSRAGPDGLLAQPELLCLFAVHLSAASQRPSQGLAGLFGRGCGPELSGSRAERRAEELEEKERPVARRDSERRGKGDPSGMKRWENWESMGSIKTNNLFWCLPSASLDTELVLF